MSLSIGWITSCLVALDFFSRLMSLTCFLPRAFIFLSWLGTSFHFIVTCWMLWDMFIDHDHLFYIIHLSWAQYPTLCTILDSILDSMHIFSLQKVKCMFSHLHFLQEIFLDHLIIFSLYGARVEG